MGIELKLPFGMSYVDMTKNKELSTSYTCLLYYWVNKERMPIKDFSDISAMIHERCVGVEGFKRERDIARVIDGELRNLRYLKAMIHLLKRRDYEEDVRDFPYKDKSIWFYSI